VTYLEPNDRGNLAAGYFKVVLDQPAEVAARQAFAEKVAIAESLVYAGVQLRCDGSVVDRWPVVVGDDPDLSDFRRAVALISHGATSHQEGLHWSLTDAAETGRLAQLLRAVDAAYRVIIEHFRADTQAIDEQIQRFATAEVADSFDVYNRVRAYTSAADRSRARRCLGSHAELCRGTYSGNSRRAGDDAGVSCT